jgi:spermidine synthase
MQRRFATLSALFGLGWISISTQIYLVREFLSLFSGNELVLGMVLGNWLLLTGLGAWLGRTIPRIRGQRTFVLFLLVLLSVIPILAVFKLDVWRSIIFPYGSMTGLWGVTYTSLIIQLPFCLINGYLFTSLTALYAESRPVGAAGTAYAVESLGSLAAGVLVNFALLWLLGTFDSLRILFAAFAVTIIIFSLSFARWWATLIVVLLMGGLVQILFKVPFIRLSNAALFRDQAVVLDKDTPYGRVVVTEASGQLNYYENGKLLFSSGNVIWNEESVHYAMLQHPAPRRVLLISGGLSGAIPEILKYHPLGVDYLEINPVLAELARRYLKPAALPQVKIWQRDARLFLRTNPRSWDVVLVNEPEPSTLQLNRFYTDEFFRLVKAHMAPGGVISLSLPTTSDYVSSEARELNSALFYTLRNNFSRVLVIPGTRNWFVASDSLLTTRIGEQAELRMPENQYVNRFYIDDSQLKERSDYILANIEKDTLVNTDFHPVIYRSQINFWLGHFRMDSRLLVAVAVVMALILLMLFSPYRSGIFAGGFTAVSLEIIVLLAFQVAFGYVFRMAGVVIMVFMAGLALGPWLSRRLFSDPGKKQFLLLQVLMAALPTLLMLVIIAMTRQVISLAVLYIALFTATLSASVLTGMEYAVAAEATRQTAVFAASRNYAADLVGSALGAFLTTIFLLPVLGINTTLEILAGMNLATAIILMVKR